MKEFLKEVLVGVLADLVSNLIFRLSVLVSAALGIVGVFMNLLLILSFLILLVLIIYEVYKTKTVGVGISIKAQATEENKRRWESQHSIWLEIENNNQNVDLKDCFVYLKKLDDNGINLLPRVTIVTNNFEWENYTKGQEKIVRSSNGKERVNIAFANGGFDNKYFLLEGGNKENIPSKERVEIEIVLVGRMKGIRVNFPISGYLVHKMLDYEKTITKEFYLELKTDSLT